MTEDITFFFVLTCEYMECIRNSKHIKLPIPHSFADFKDTEYCPLRKNEKE